MENNNDNEPREITGRPRRTHEQMRSAFAFLMDEEPELSAFRASLTPEQWQRIVGFAAVVIETQRAHVEGEPCPKLLAHNGTRAPCRQRTDGRCCWCERPM